MKKSCKLLVAMLAVFIMLLITGCDQLMSPGGGTDEAFTVTFVTNHFYDGSGLWLRKKSKSGP